MNISFLYVVKTRTIIFIAKMVQKQSQTANVKRKYNLNGQHANMTPIDKGTWQLSLTNTLNLYIFRLRNHRLNKTLNVFLHQIKSIIKRNWNLGFFVPFLLINFIGIELVGVHVQDAIEITLHTRQASEFRISIFWWFWKFKIKHFSGFGI